MHDLDIILSPESHAAVEVAGAADRVAIEHWNVMNGGDRRIVNSIRGGWAVEVRVGSSWNRLQTELPRLLGGLEA